MTSHRIAWDRGTATVEAVGAMLAPVNFRLDDGRTVQPMAIGPWGDDDGADHDALPGILKRLRGEWPCVPFGAPSAPEGLPAGWAGPPVQDTGDDFHGYGSHHAWRVERQGAGHIELAIEYPADHAIARLRRTIAGVPGRAEIALTLTIDVRRPVAVPIALHPVFRLASEPGASRLDVGSFDHGRVFPLAVEPGVSRLEPDKVFHDLGAVSGRLGDQTLDRLPLDFDTEELVQLMGAKGRVSLTNPDDGYRVELSYDAEVFPSVLLWISNRGRTAYPWNGRFVALGIEPVRGAFDLGPQVGCNRHNPIAASGHATRLDLSPDQPFTTRYTIAASPL